MIVCNLEIMVLLHVSIETVNPNLIAAVICRKKVFWIFWMSTKVQLYCTKLQLKVYMDV